MDDNYLMRKEGLTMTNEDSVNTSLECEPRAVSGPPNSPSHQPPPLAMAFQPGRSQMCPEIFVAPLADGSGGPIPSLGPQDGERAVIIVGTGWKNRRKELSG